MENANLDSLNKFTEVLHKQNEKGLKKYGQPLDPLDKRYDFLEMLLEELVDAVQYARSEQIKRKNAADEIRRVIEPNVIPMVYDQVNALLNQFEGK